MCLPKVAIISNVNCDFIQRDLSRKYNVFPTEGYGNWISYCLVKDTELWKFQPDYLFVLLHGDELIHSYDDRDEIIRNTFHYLSKLIENYTNANVFVSSIDYSMRNKVGNAIDEAIVIKYLWEEKLLSLTNAYTNAYRIDIDLLFRKLGYENSYSSKLWYTASIPYSLSAINEIEKEIERCIDKGNRKKLFIVDLDNTLWGGVVGEVGTNNIDLGNSKKGLIFSDVQHALLKLKNRGGLIAAISKNNIKDVEDVFLNNNNMVLAKDDFVAIYANWREKSENIQDMVQALNIGQDACVFLDDNPIERDKVRISCPEVEVLEYPTEVCDLPKTVYEAIDKYFFVWNVLEEDKNKTRMYHNNQLRAEAKKQAISYEEYLRSLNSVVTIRKARRDDVQRIEQLLNKTNQFNTRTVRMNAPEVEKYISMDNHIIFLVEVDDKYGFNGTVGAVLLRSNQREAFLDNFVLSCRVMGRKIEDVVISSIINWCNINSINIIKTEYIPSAKNAPVCDLWEKEGFIVDDVNESNIKRYHLDVVERVEIDFCKVIFEL